MQSQRDSNIMSAWEKGGVFEGNVVTDERVLAYWKSRMRHVDSRDPLYDAYKNAYMQIDYSIHESKMSTAYAQGRATDMDMANFYMNWAKKVPKNSEFYRVLQRDAAQFMRTARAKAEQAARERAEANYQNRMKAMYKKDQAASDYMLGVMNSLARSGNAGAGIAPVAGSVLAFDPTDPEAMLRLIDLIQPRTGEDKTGESPARTTNKDVLFHDADGRPVTGADIVERLGKLDADFANGGTVDVGYIKDLINRQRASIKAQIKLANDTGHVTDANKLKENLDTIAEVGRQINAYPVQQQYMDLNADWVATRDNPYLSVPAKQEAWKKYQAALFALAEDPRISADDYTKNTLIAEANLTPNAPTLAEDFSGESRGKLVADGQGMANAVAVETWDDHVSGVESGEYAWTQGTWDSKGQFVPKADGLSWGAASIRDIQALSPAPTVTAMVPSGDGRSFIKVLLTGAEVTVSAANPLGTAATPTTQNPVATMYTGNVNGRVVEMWAYNNGGQIRYTTDPPWDQRAVRVVRNAAGVELELLNAPANKDVLNSAPANFPGWKIVPQSNGTSQWVYDPFAGVFGTDPTRLSATPDPFTDFLSPTMAMTMALPDGSTVIKQMMRYPEFGEMLDAELHEAAGQRYDVTAGQWVGPSGQPDPVLEERYNQLKAQNDVTSRRGAGGSWDTWADSIMRLWDKVSTQPTVDGARAQDFPVDNTVPEQLKAKLPTDLIRQWPTSTGWEALAGIFRPGTNLIQFASDDKKKTGAITMGQPLRLPDVSTRPIIPTPAVTNNSPGYSPPNLNLTQGSAYTGQTPQASWDDDYRSRMVVK
jgi:hypothetical protein